MKLGIISDVHEDIKRLEEAFHLLDQLGCNEIVCLGDICGFVIPSFGYFEERDASACVQMIRNNCKYIVAGNHDLSAVKRIPEFQAGFDYPENWYALDHKQRMDLAGQRIWLNEEVEMDSLLSSDERRFLESIPEFQVISDKGIGIMLSHYLYPDLSGSSILHYENFGPIENHFEFMEKQDCQVGFSGHQHVEGFFRATRLSAKYHEFGSVDLERQMQWVVGPCVANGKRENGCMVFDTETFNLNAIPLNTPPRVMMTIDYYGTTDKE